MKYRIVGSYLRFPSGAVLRLTPQQFAARAHAVQVQPDGSHRVVVECGFKHGEVVDVVGGAELLNPAQLEVLPEDLLPVPPTTDVEGAEVVPDPPRKRLKK